MKQFYINHKIILDLQHNWSTIFEILFNERWNIFAMKNFSDVSFYESDKFMKLSLAHKIIVVIWQKLWQPGHSRGSEMMSPGLYRLYGPFY